MIQEIVMQWEKGKAALAAALAGDSENYYSYSDLLMKLVSCVLTGYDPESITEIDQGDCQGTLVFLFHEKTYQPSASDYIVASVSYGSCSACDTLQEVMETRGKERINGLMTLCLHLIQSMKKIV